MHLERIVVHGLRAAATVPFSCDLPGRFSVLAGANSGGKSTLVDAIVLAHRDVFPYTPRPSSSVLSQSVATHTVDIEYALPPTDPSPLGDLLTAHGTRPNWTTTLRSSMGRVSASSSQGLNDGQLPVLYFSPTRNPSLDLGGREARLIVELLKSQGLRDRGDKSLSELRGLLGGLIGSVVNKWPVDAAEQRVGAQLAELTAGVAEKVPYLGTTRIDDTFLARVFEFLIATPGTARAGSRRIETEGLGYAHLLELGVILAAIPDLTHVTPPIASPPPDSSEDADLTPEEREQLMRGAEVNAAVEGETFFAGSFHAVVILEEPEAHLHPQLQRGLVTYLKEVVKDRPEVQVILTTHSDQIISACDPEDLVVCVRTPDGPAARTVMKFGLAPTHLALARRHLDASRSASIFSDRVVLVEGISDATVLRAFARVWAGDDRIKTRFVDALTISVVGSRVGPWLYRLLANPAHPICAKLAILSDSDGNVLPKWVAPATAMSVGRLRVFFSEPTLEPSLVTGNAQLFKDLFDHKAAKSRPWEDGEQPTVDNVAKFFRDGGRSKKASFADEVAAYCAERASDVTIPPHFLGLLDFMWDGFVPTASDGEADVEAEAEVAGEGGVEEA